MLLPSVDFSKKPLSLAVPLQAGFPSLLLSSLLGLCHMCLAVLLIGPHHLLVDGFLDFPKRCGMYSGFPQLLNSRIEVFDGLYKIMYLLDVCRRFEAVYSEPGSRWCHWANIDIDINR